MIRDTHQELNNRVNNVEGGTFSDHATHVAGTIGAAGLDANAQGMASHVSLRGYTSGNDTVEMADAATNALIEVSNHSYGIATGWQTERALDWGLDSPSGWIDVWFGDRTLSGQESHLFGKYEQSAVALDTVLHDHPELLSVWSAGNDRSDQYWNASNVLGGAYLAFFTADPGNILAQIPFSGPGFYPVPDAVPTVAPPPDGNGGTGFDTLPVDQVAKNTLVVGAVDDVDWEAPNVVITVAAFSNFGPTDDGRIKPDIVGNGVALHSSVATADNAYDGDPTQGDPNEYSGTSMAAPNVTGTAVLLIEHFENEFKEELRDEFEDEFHETPRAATTKGIMLHTAHEAGNVGPDYTFGWGLLDAEEAAKFITEAADSGSPHAVRELTYDGSENAYGGDEMWTQPIVSRGPTPWDPENPDNRLTVTISWTDPEGTAHGDGLDDDTSVLVNDLDLWITDAAGTPTYYRPWVLDPADPDDAATRYSGTSSSTTYRNELDNVEQVVIDAPSAGLYYVHVGHTDTLRDDSQKVSVMISGAIQEFYWDESGDANWGTANWEDGDGNALTATPTFPDQPTLDAVVRTDTVSVAADRDVRDLNVKSGLVDVQQGVELSVARDLELGDSAGIDVAGDFDLSNLRKRTWHLGRGTVGLLDAEGDVTLGTDTTLDLAIHGDPSGEADNRFQAGTYTLIEGDSITGTFDLAVLPGMSPSRPGLYQYATGGPNGDGLTYSGSAVTLTIDHDLHPGDANLDKNSNIIDFNVWNSHKFNSGTVWTEGNFDDNTITDVRDFNIWNTNKFTSVDEGEAAAPAGGGAAAMAQFTQAPALLYIPYLGQMHVYNYTANLIAMVIEGPQAVSIDRWQSGTTQDGMTWSQRYFGGAEQWYGGMNRGSTPPWHRERLTHSTYLRPRWL